jgi:hypothetical protein
LEAGDHLWVSFQWNCTTYLPPHHKVENYLMCTLAIALLLFFLRFSVFSSNVPLLDELAFANSNLQMECLFFFFLNVNII